MKIALVHDLLTQLGGAERVLDCFLEMYPKAPVYTLLYDKAATESRYEGFDVRPSFLQKLPRFFSYKWYLPLMRRAVESFDLSAFDLVLSDASAFAKGVRISGKTFHICYCHTPTRYLWQDRESYVKALPYPTLIRLVLRPLLAALVKWDLQAAGRVNFFIANSEEVRSRIKKYYSREAEVIYPPVDTNFFNIEAKPERAYYLTAGRAEPYKRTELVIKTFLGSNRVLKIAGTGSMLNKLRETYRAPNIRFLGRVGDGALKKLYQNAKAFIFPALEDAGLMILESLACGTPVIAYAAGGALEFVRDGQEGVLFPEQTPSSLFNALRRFENSAFEPLTLRTRALDFDKRHFNKRMSETINRALGEKKL